VLNRSIDFLGDAGVEAGRVALTPQIPDLNMMKYIGVARRKSGIFETVQYRNGPQFLITLAKK